MKKLKLIPTIIIKYMLRAFYFSFSLLISVDERKITFASYQSDTLRDNLYYVNKEIALNYPEFKRYFLFKKFDSSILGKIIYIGHMIKSSYHLATSRYFIIDDYYFPIYVLKIRKNVDVIQLWHSAGAFKKFGLSLEGKSTGPSSEYLKHVKIHGNYTKAYVSSKEIIPYYAEAFQLVEEKIYPLGIPRTDFFFEKEYTKAIRKKLYEKYPELVNKKILLYAPTFRGKSHYQDTFSLPFDISYMAERLQNDYALFIHLHPYMHSDLKLDRQDFTYEIKDSYTIQQLLAITDILITDYSTVFFDYSLLERPMIFYPYDLESYKKERDFYYEYEDIIPGPIVRDTETLVKLIKQNSFNIQRVRDFSHRFFDYRDGKSTERIVKHILNK